MVTRHVRGRQSLRRRGTKSFESSNLKIEIETEPSHRGRCRPSPIVASLAPRAAPGPKGAKSCSPCERL